MKKENGKEFKKIFLLGFSFRDRLNPWLNFDFAFMDALVPGWKECFFQFTEGQNKMLDKKSSNLFENRPELGIKCFHQ